ncbi:DUF5367 domain-containing protein [Shouchella patagoniensis]|uniref:DUF5367 domain-containing protein n=1 Tax=Shouchella patagoniensis TaxID=228576 RepID=UPI001FE38E34|nr:DUF5367 domain-containing protein [Shouchella patagoniensis]
MWLGATAIFRLLGQFFFTSDNTLFLVATYLIVIPLILVLTLPLYRYKKVDAFNRLKAAIFIALPGMLLDVVVLIYFSDVFVNLEPEMDRMFASWLLLAYSIILLTGLTPNRKHSS